VEIAPGRAGFGHCCAHNAVKRLDVGAGGDFRDDAAERGVLLDLAEYDIGQDGPGPVGGAADHRCRRFVAARLDAEHEEGACGFWRHCDWAGRGLGLANQGLRARAAGLVTSAEMGVQTGAVRIGTRGSRLALWQAGAVRDALALAHGMEPERFEVVTISTSGDRIQDRALLEAGGKGLFTKEIEEALLSGAIDLAVHSAKDMQTFCPWAGDRGLSGARGRARRADRQGYGQPGRTAGGSGAGHGVAAPGGAGAAGPADMRIALLRGNVPTRLRRVEAGEYDATLLAAAGLKRLDLDNHITAFLPLDSFPPACGQGAVAIECRAGDGAVRQMLAPIDHQETAAAVTCERAFLGSLDGSCRTPIAGYATTSGGALRFNGVCWRPMAGNRSRRA
jgi:hydroxymethylbilane synthase